MLDVVSLLAELDMKVESTQVLNTFVVQFR
jgi:hypothetical protein